MSESFQDRRAGRKTPPGVLAAEIASRSIISAAGIGVIAALLLVFVFLASVAVPLARRTEVRAASRHGASGASDAPFLAADEFLIAGFTAHDGGRALRHFRLDTGELLGDVELFPRRPTALSFSPVDGRLAVGFEDGTTVLGRIFFQTRFYEHTDVPEHLRGLEEGAVGVLDGNAVERTPVGQYRQQALTIELDPPVAGATDSSVILIDKTVRHTGPVVAALNADGLLSIVAVNLRRNILTGEVTETTSRGTLPVSRFDPHNPPHTLLVNAFADTVYLIWRDGRYARIDSRDLQRIRIVERGTLLGPGASGPSVTVASFLLGDGTILVGDSAGVVSTWFAVRREDSATEDGLMLVNTTRFDGPAAVTAVATSSRKRLIAVGYEDGSARTFYVTSRASLADVDLSPGAPVVRLSISPRDDALLALSSSGLTIVDHDSPHPEATIRSLFGRVWYEGNAEPAHIWQSSGGTDAFEPKYGLVPLIFGTLKAALFSMLFGVPIALLAAIYTSEFLTAKLRSRIKPIVEMMASVPGVVLGFLAALVVAPFASRVVPTLLLSFIVVPLVFVVSGYAIRLLPSTTRVLVSRHRFAIVLCGALPLGIIIAVAGGGPFERILFAGDILAWLDGRIGSGWGGWVLLLIPGSAALVASITAKRVHPWLRRVYRARDDRSVSRLELGRFVIGVIATLVIAGGIAGLLTLVGIDSRADFPWIGPVLGTYVQRNSLIVGFVMGFAIIPIIYTISVDALRSVPDHLRSASLASGATPWQTTVRIILPTAMSGLFSAVMIGLGRAIGETMIVLMATGNTPIMEMNIFNGFRTLAANIAVELPEAAAGSTHYRVLFLAALTLFVITFVINTAAEAVRQRFRKRAFQL